MIEKYGSGIKRIQEGFIDYGLPEPIFEEIQGGFRVTVHSSPNNLKSSTINNTVGETAHKMLKYLQTKPHATRTELAELLDLSIRGVEYNLKILKESGRLILKIFIYHCSC